MVILPHHIIESLLSNLETTHSLPLSLQSQDDGDVYVAAELVRYRASGSTPVNGTLQITSRENSPKVKNLLADTDVLVIGTFSKEAPISSITLGELEFTAWKREAGVIEKLPVRIIHLGEEIYSRVRGLYETDALRNKAVLIIGVGSGGSAIAIELAKAGVSNFILVDHDRLEVANIVRHVCGVSDIGRYKTKAVKDFILEKNPSANVETYEEKCEWSGFSKLKELASKSDLIFCCTDNRPSRVLVNLVSLEERRVCIYGGTHSRAYGGHVLRVIPTETMCYQCLIDLMPEKAEDQEIASQAQADSIAYADRPVAIEPGLANDIAPIANMCVKLGILELLRGTNTTLASLYDDLSNAWYMWLNRREANTEYADLPPLDNEGNDGPRILAWYGILNETNPDCPACGDFVSAQIGEQKRPTPEQIKAFEADTQDEYKSEILPPPE